MAELEASDLLAKLTAKLLDQLDEMAAHTDVKSIRLDEALIVVELTAVEIEDGEDVEYSRAMIKATTDSPVYQRGLAQVACELLDNGGPIPDNGPGE